MKIVLDCDWCLNDLGLRSTPETASRGLRHLSVRKPRVLVHDDRHIVPCKAATRYISSQVVCSRSIRVGNSARSKMGSRRYSGHFGVYTIILLSIATRIVCARLSTKQLDEALQVSKLLPIPTQAE